MDIEAQLISRGVTPRLAAYFAENYGFNDDLDIDSLAYTLVPFNDTIGGQYPELKFTPNVNIEFGTPEQDAQAAYEQIPNKLTMRPWDEYNKPKQGSHFLAHELSHAGRSRQFGPLGAIYKHIASDNPNYPANWPKDYPKAEKLAEATAWDTTTGNQSWSKDPGFLTEAYGGLPHHRKVPWYNEVPLWLRGLLE